MTEYSYICDDCNTTWIVKKPMSESNRLEYCPTCKSLLRRDYTTSHSTMTLRQDKKWKDVDWNDRKPPKSEPLE